jgi:hypothetical protein
MIYERNDIGTRTNTESITNHFGNHFQLEIIKLE